MTVMSSTEPPAIDIQVGMSQPWTHYFEVSMTVTGIVREYLDLVMPVWTPGSYMIREFSRHVRDFAATKESGEKLAWEKTNKNVWRVYSKKEPRVLVQYHVYAFERSVRTSFLDDSHAYINGASVFMYVDGLPHHPIHLKIVPYPGWTRISTGLDPVRGNPGTFFAPDFDALADSPVEVGNHQVLEFKFQEIPHFISLYGDGNHDAGRLLSDFHKIVEAAVSIVGEIPYRHYTFLIQLLPEGGGGLEHINSASIHVSRWTFRPEGSYRKFLSLVAHEYFHLWNVKRIRPQGLGPFDYTRETYTRLLWVSEGFTEYYANQILRRSGLITAERYLEDLSGTIQEFRETPGRLVDSAAAASFDAWIKHYRRDENSPNATVSYYMKGELIALVMDLEIRQHTAGAKSLDDVMRLLYAKYYKKSQRGFTDWEFRKACEEIAGAALCEILDCYAYGTVEMDFARYLDRAGLKFAGPERETAKGYLGIHTKAIEGRVVIIRVTEGSPAYDQGLNVNDELIAVDGYRVELDSLAARVEETEPGSRLEITVARAEKLRTIPVILGAKEVTESKIVRISNPTAAQEQLYESWLLAPWDPPQKDCHRDAESTNK